MAAKIDIRQLNKEVPTVDPQRDTVVTEVIEFTQGGQKIHSFEDSIIFQDENGKPFLKLKNNINSVNYFSIDSSNLDSTLYFKAEGSDQDIDILISPKGNANLILDKPLKFTYTSNTVPFSPFVLPNNASLMVNNLNAQYLGGYTVEELRNLNNYDGILPISLGGTNNNTFVDLELLHFESGQLKSSGKSIDSFSLVSHDHDDIYEFKDPTILKSSDVISNLNSTSNTKPLSASQGKLLQDTKISIPSNILSNSLPYFNDSNSLESSDILISDIALKSDLEQNSSKLFFLDTEKTVEGSRDGTIYKPFNSLQSIIDDNTLPNDLTVIFSGELTENIVFNSSKNINLIGLDTSSCIINGHLTFITNVNVSISNISVNFTDPDVLGVSVSSINELKLNNCDLQYTQLSAKYFFECNSTSGSIKLNNVKSSGTNAGFNASGNTDIYLNNCDISSTFYANNTTSINVYNSYLSNIFHIAGNLNLRNCTLKDFESIANGATNVLSLINNTNRNGNTNTFYGFLKTGNSPYIISNNDFDLSIQLSGLSIDKTLNSSDIKVSYTPSSYISTDNLLNSHLEGIDNKISLISLQVSNLFFNNGTDILKHGEKLTLDLNYNDNRTFNTLMPFVSIQIYLNGLRMTLDSDYLVIDDHTIQFISPVIDPNNELIIADYLIKS